MKKRHFLGMVTLVSMLFIGGCSTDLSQLENPTTNNSESILAEANWATDVVSLEEVTENATLIVRAKVQSQTERVESESLPGYGFPNADPSTPLEELDPEQAIQEGEKVVYTPFTDTTFEVIEVYKGDTSSTIKVSQLGGTMPHPIIEGEQASLAIEGNPIFSPNSEHFLFLVPLPDTEQLFAIVGPAGRYEVQGELVIPTVDLGEFSGRPIQTPKTVAEIVTYISLN